LEQNKTLMPSKTCAYAYSISSLEGVQGCSRLRLLTCSTTLSLHTKFPVPTIAIQTLCIANAQATSVTQHWANADLTSHVSTMISKVSNRRYYLRSEDDQLPVPPTSDVSHSSCMFLRNVVQLKLLMHFLVAMRKTPHGDNTNGWSSSWKMSQVAEGLPSG
jgi:hypothetical protein